jgi:hypothetical protein
MAFKVNSIVLKINLPPSLQTLVENVQQIDIGGSTIGECLENMVRQHPALNIAVFDNQRCLQKGLSLFLNGETVSDFGTPVKSDDQLYIFNILVGG